jgi:phosphocarrier protein HPr
MNVEERFKIVNALGLHARAAVKLVQEANRYQSEIHLSREGVQEVNAKSIMGVLTLAAGCGTEVQVRCEGPDAGKALEAIRVLFESGFGED